MGDDKALVTLERRGNIALITLNRPDARNAISPEVSQTMAALLDEVEADEQLRAVVLTGAGEVFSAGADLKVVAQGRAMDIARGKGGFAGIVTRDFPKPLIAAVNGPALAGGFEIVLSCDLVIASDTARFGIPEVQRGLMAAAGGLIRLPKRVPLAIALELAMTGDPIDANRALALGLVNRVVNRDRVVDEATALAERIGQNSPIAVRQSRQLVREAAELPEAEGWRRTNELVLDVFASGDAVEGATAFAEKRPPVWKST
jgi:enoyl-CoA hydratase